MTLVSALLIADILAGALAVALPGAERTAGQSRVASLGIGEITRLTQAEIAHLDTAAVGGAIAAAAGVAVGWGAADIGATAPIRDAPGAGCRLAPARRRRGDRHAPGQTEQAHHAPPGETTAEPTRQRIETSRLHRTILPGVVDADPPNAPGTTPCYCPASYGERPLVSIH